MILYDKKVQRSTLKNDNEGPFISFGEWANAAYRGKVFAQQGRFEAEWVMPLTLRSKWGKANSPSMRRRIRRMPRQRFPCVDWRY